MHRLAITAFAMFFSLCATLSVGCADTNRGAGTRSDGATTGGAGPANGAGTDLGADRRTTAGQNTGGMGPGGMGGTGATGTR